jgi:hypothetical protein
VLETLGARAVAGRGGKRRWVIVDDAEPSYGLAFETRASSVGTTIDVVPIEHGFARDSSLLVRVFLSVVAFGLMAHALVSADGAASVRTAIGILLGWAAVMAVFDVARWVLLHPLLANGTLLLTRRRVRSALFAHENDLGRAAPTRRGLSH